MIRKLSPGRLEEAGVEHAMGGGDVKMMAMIGAFVAFTLGVSGERIVPHGPANDLPVIDVEYEEASATSKVLGNRRSVLSGHSYFHSLTPRFPCWFGILRRRCDRWRWR